MNATQKNAGSQKKNIITAVVRWSMAILLLALVIRSGKLDLSDLGWFREYPYRALGLYLVALSCALTAMVRWWQLARALDLKIDLGTAIRLGMLGQFFSTVLPGTVGGDFIKAVYVARRFPSRMARSVVTLVADRLSGLTAVIFLGTLGTLAGFSRLTTLEGNMGHLVRSYAFLLAGIGAVFFCVLFSFPFFAKKLPKHLPKFILKLPKSGILQQIYESLVDYRESPFALWRAVGLSMILQLVNVGVVWTVASTIFGPHPWGTLDFPSFVLAYILGVCAMQIPLAPMGLGLGQIVFGPIFFTLGAPTTSFGAALITSQQLMQIFVNLLGVIFFATYRHQVDETLKHSESIV
jgi:uncharacterized membrane protein YbhN (UPF0104 family)